jgi:hypothetical protein
VDGREDVCVFLYVFMCVCVCVSVCMSVCVCESVVSVGEWMTV